MKDDKFDLEKKVKKKVRLRILLDSNLFFSSWPLESYLLERLILINEFTGSHSNR